MRALGEVSSVPHFPSILLCFVHRACALVFLSLHACLSDVQLCWKGALSKNVVTGVTIVIQPADCFLLDISHLPMQTVPLFK